jgi:guanylate kinase
MIIILRGRAATGKSTIAKAFSKKTGFGVTSKDSVFDELLSSGVEWSTANRIAYDKLAERIEVFQDSNQDLIVDLGLAHTPYFEEFLSKITNKDELKLFLVECSDYDDWKNRIKERVLNPTSPNQMFQSVEDAINHYQRYNIYSLENEVILDGCASLRNSVKTIKDNL